METAVAMMWSMCGSITVPKMLAIKNQRLGILFRLLQIGAIVIICLMVFVSKSWNTQEVPVSNGGYVYAEDGSATAMQNSSVAHCNNVASYAYQYTSSIRYAPAECRLLPRGENFIKQGANLYIPTHIEDTYTTEVPLAQCSSLVCPSTMTKVQSSVQCLCEQKSEYFSKNPEQVEIILNHGFEVARVNAFGEKSSTPEKARSGINEGEDKNILTLITDSGDDKKRCLIGGKSAWTQVDSQNGIRGTLADWIRCGGSNLDIPAPNQVSGEACCATPPKVRIVGLSLQITIAYRNKYQSHVDGDPDHDGPVAYVRINALPIWNSMNSVQFTEIPHAGSPGSTYRYRYAYGVSVSMQATGTFYWFDLNALILTITSSLVLISIPGTIVQIIALYAAGRISKIYCAVAIETFSIVDRFGGLCARLLGYATNFNAIAKKVPGSDELILDTDTLDHRLREVLADQMQKGTDADGNTIDPILGEGEVKNMSAFLMNQLDPQGEAKVSLQEYLRACNSQEAIKMRDLAVFFDDQRQKTCLESVFGDVSQQIQDVQAELRQRSAGTSGSAKVHPDP
mmetsp:Transcript_94579/g.147908  ORF Transcript_94579/g.147908 Transcript_94579/m.147908 type:complete len:568 (-) Transcript_94579:55-1758(-)